MLHKDDFGNMVGTPADWVDFYKWCVARDLPYNATPEQCIKEYLKAKSDDNKQTKVSDM